VEEERITITQFASVELDYRGGGTCNCSRQIEQALETGKLPLITSQSMDTMCRHIMRHDNRTRPDEGEGDGVCIKLYHSRFGARV
jgi:hypothetical protein